MVNRLCHSPHHPFSWCSGLCMVPSNFSVDRTGSLLLANKITKRIGNRMPLTPMIRLHRIVSCILERNSFFPTFGKPCSNFGKVQVTRQWGYPPANNQQRTEGGHLPAVIQQIKHIFTSYGHHDFYLYCQFLTPINYSLHYCTQDKLVLATMTPIQYMPVHAQTIICWSWLVITAKEKVLPKES